MNAVTKALAIAEEIDRIRADLADAEERRRLVMHELAADGHGGSAIAGIVRVTRQRAHQILMQAERGRPGRPRKDEQGVEA